MQSDVAEGKKSDLFDKEFAKKENLKFYAMKRCD